MKIQRNIWHLLGCMRQVCQLPYKIRKGVELYYLEEMKTKEIAQILRISDASVGKRLERGRNMLREKGGNHENHADTVTCGSYAI